MRKRNESGSLLTDVMLGMVLFAILSTIAVSGLSQWRERAWAHSVLADAERVANAVYMMTVDPERIVAAGVGMSVTPKLVVVDPADVDDPLAATGATLSKDNILLDWKITRDHRFGFCIEHNPLTPGAWAAYRSDKGGIYAKGRKGGCEGPDAPDVTAGLDDEDEVPDETLPPVPGGMLPVRDWADPQSAADIEELCLRDWGDRAIYGDGKGTLYGTPGDDVIIGGNQGQVIYGLGGDDIICGGNGKDTLYGGDGSDILMGGNGKDTLYGGRGVDFLHGNNGKDSMYVGDGFQDVAFGGRGPDVYLEDGPEDPVDRFVQGGSDG